MVDWATQPCTSGGTREGTAPTIPYQPGSVFQHGPKMDKMVLGKRSFFPGRKTLFNFKDLVFKDFLKKNFQRLAAQKKQLCPKYPLLCHKSSWGHRSRPHYLSVCLRTGFCLPGSSASRCLLHKDTKNHQMKLAPWRNRAIKHMALKLHSLLVDEGHLRWLGFFVSIQGTKPLPGNINQESPFQLFCIYLL